MKALYLDDETQAVVKDTCAKVRQAIHDQDARVSEQIDALPLDDPSAIRLLEAREKKTARDLEKLEEFEGLIFDLLRSEV